MPTSGMLLAARVALHVFLAPALAQQPRRTGRALLLDQRLIFRDGLLPRNAAAGMDGPYEVVRPRTRHQSWGADVCGRLWRKRTAAVHMTGR